MKRKLLISEKYGVYLPKIFADNFASNFTNAKQQVSKLAKGPCFPLRREYNRDYEATWKQVLRHAYRIDSEGKWFLRMEPKGDLYETIENRRVGKVHFRTAKITLHEALNANLAALLLESDNPNLLPQTFAVTQKGWEIYFSNQEALLKGPGTLGYQKAWKYTLRYSTLQEDGKRWHLHYESGKLYKVLGGIVLPKQTSNLETNIAELITLGLANQLLDATHKDLAPKQFANSKAILPYKNISGPNFHTLVVGPSKPAYLKVWEEVLETARREDAQGTWRLWQSTDSAIYEVHENEII